MILNGKCVQDEIIDKLEHNFRDKNIKNAIIIVGDDPASKTYVKNKVEVCAKAHIDTEVIELPNDISEEELLLRIHHLNNDDTITGILVQLPLPKHINENKVAVAISPAKDLDCFNPVNVGNMFLGNMTPGKDILPATPLGILMLLNSYYIPVVGKNVVVVGRSNIVGKPIATMLTNLGATVTVCHSRTKNLKKITKKADICILAVGKARMFDRTWFNSRAVIIDVGINRANGKLCGDFDKFKHPYESKFSKSEKLHITPVPNGVGRTTVAALIYNTLACYKMNNHQD